MGFRYRRSIKLGSGVRLNVSKRGLSSVSIGKPGSTLNVGRRGVRSTVGLPGTGLSYSTGSGSGGGVVAVLGLIGAVLGAAFWLLGAAARGNRIAQLTIVGIAALSLFAYLHVPQDDASPVPAAAMSSPLAVAIPSVAAIIPALPAVQASARSDNAMRTTTGANLRSGPSPQAKAVEQLPGGALVDVIGGEGQWAKVRVADRGTTGWVAWSLLGKPKPTTADTRPKTPESIFDPADISAILNTAPPR